MVFRLALPIALQNLINTALSSADVVMLNYVSQEALAAAADCCAIVPAELGEAIGDYAAIATAML